MMGVWSKFSKKVQLFLETFRSFPIVWKQHSQVFAVVMVVIRQPGKHILQPLLRVNNTGIAGANERINHSCVFCSIVVSAEQIRLLIKRHINRNTFSFNFLYFLQ